MLGTVYESSILYIKIKVATRERARFLNPLFLFDSYELSNLFFFVLILKFCFDQISLENLNNNDTGNKTIGNLFVA